MDNVCESGRVKCCLDFYIGQILVLVAGYMCHVQYPNYCNDYDAIFHKVLTDGVTQINMALIPTVL